jgi:hypothetical protein
LSFGGLLCAGIAALVYFSFPAFFVNVNVYLFISAFGILGAALQQVVEKGIALILGPIGRFISFYENLLELALLKRKRVLTEEHHQAIVNKLCEQRFLNSKQ